MPIQKPGAVAKPKVPWWSLRRYMEKPTRKDQVLAWIMLTLVFVEASFLFIQAAKGFTSKSAEDVDLTAFIILLVTNVGWFIYGMVVLRDLPVIVSGFLYSIGAVLVIVTVVLYGD